MSALALPFFYCGYNVRAAPLFEKVVEAERRVQGEEHPDTLAGMDSLAAVYLRLGKSARSESLFEREVELNRRGLGPEHPYIQQHAQSGGGIPLPGPICAGGQLRPPR